MGQFSITAGQRNLWKGSTWNLSWNWSFGHVNLQTRCSDTLANAEQISCEFCKQATAHSQGIFSRKVPSSSTSSNNNVLRCLICNLCINISAASGSAARGRMSSRMCSTTGALGSPLKQTDVASSASNTSHFWSQNLLIQ